MESTLGLEIIEVVEQAAIASARWMGKGEKDTADQVAVEAMRERMNQIHMRGRIVIGEGERDEAPMLYIGEEVGDGKGPKIDIALDPLEGTDITAAGGPNALAVVAMTDEGGFLNAPDTYMDKIAVGPGVDPNILDLDAPIGDVLNRLAKEKGGKVGDLTVCILDRPRHEDLIAGVRAAGARINLIGDGDVSAVIATTDPDTGIDLYVGNGGAPEGVLAAAALQCTGGAMLGRLVFHTDIERERADKWGISDRHKIYTTDELAKPDNVMFAATGVTDGSMLRGVRRYAGGAKTSTLVMRSKSGTVRRIEATHNLNRKTWLKNI